MHPLQTQYRRAVEEDRAFLARMLELTETWGEPDRELPENFPSDVELNVHETPPQS